MLNTAKYALIPHTNPYVFPAQPVLNIPPTATQHQIAVIKELYHKSLQLFCEVTAIEWVLIQLIVSELDAKYLQAPQNSCTNKITHTIPQILAHLFSNYDDVTKEELQEIRSNVENMQFHPNKPMDTVFTEIDTLTDLAELADSPLSEAQKIELGYIILQKAIKFKLELKARNRMPILKHTCNNFKDHF